MPYRIEIDRQALKALAALPKKVQRQIATRIDSLAEEPFPPDAQQIKGQDAIWRMRSGSYRIAYTVLHTDGETQSWLAGEGHGNVIVFTVGQGDAAAGVDWFGGDQLATVVRRRGQELGLG